MAAMLRIEVVYALPTRCWSVRLELPPGATVAEALTAAAMESKVPGLVVDATQLAVYGRSVTPSSQLHDGDRIEILRPLLADPKQARRKRAEVAAKLSRR
jgi:putative ubiquitin-RnfH superfamily antitoxin RatB of RatAB toxin-antitoxin module